MNQVHVEHLAADNHIVSVNWGWCAHLADWSNTRSLSRSVDGLYNPLDQHPVAWILVCKVREELAAVKVCHYIMFPRIGRTSLPPTKISLESEKSFPANSTKTRWPLTFSGFSKS